MHKVMNNLVQIREKIRRLERLHQAQLSATKNGEVKLYRQSVFEKRKKEAQRDLQN